MTGGYEYRVREGLRITTPDGPARQTIDPLTGVRQPTPTAYSRQEVSATTTDGPAATSCAKESMKDFLIHRAEYIRQWSR